jgi:hypothetical protein
MNRRLTILVLALLLACFPHDVSAFVNVDLTDDIAGAPRWSSTEPAGRGLADGKLSVAIEPGFAEEIALAVTGATAPEDVADLEAAVSAAFGSWQSPALRFDVTFDGGAADGELDGAEIDVFAVLSSHPKFVNTGAFFGVTYDDWTFRSDRALTNGNVLPGLVINGADIFIATDRLAAVAGNFTREQQLSAFQRLMTHEIGHAIGLHHPGDGPTINFDSDTDPSNAILIDPTDPLADIALSPNLDTLAVMNNLPSDPNALFYTSLRNDDRGGRDVLYPALGATPDVCQPVPLPSCRAPRGSSLRVRDDSEDDKDKVVWRWTEGPVSAASDFGSPATATRYSLCIYQGTVPHLAAELALPAGTRWGSLRDRGFKYADSSALPHGARNALLEAGARNQSKVIVKGRGRMLPDGWLPLTAPVAVQLIRADTMGCWGATYQEADVSSSGDGGFDAKSQ